METGRAWIEAIGAGLVSVLITCAATFSYLAIPPWGFILAALAVCGFLLATRMLTEHPAPGIVAGIAALLVLALIIFDPFGGAAGGSVIVPADPWGWSWMAVVGIAATLAISWPSPRKERTTTAPTTTITTIDGEGSAP